MPVLLSGHTTSISSITFSPTHLYTCDMSGHLFSWQLDRVQSPDSRPATSFLLGHPISHAVIVRTIDGMERKRKYPKKGQEEEEVDEVEGAVGERTSRVGGVDDRALVAVSSGGGSLVVGSTVDRSLLCCASTNGRLFLLDMEQAAIAAELRMHVRPQVVNALAVAPNGLVAGSVCDGGLLAVWDVRTGDVIAKHRHALPLTAVAALTDGRFAVAGIDPVIRVYHQGRLDGSPVFTLPHHTDTVTSLAVSWDGTRLASTAMDGTVAVWDVQPYCAGERLVKQWSGVQHGMDQALIGVAWSRDDKFIATGSGVGVACVWNARSGDRVREVTGHTGTVNVVAFLPGSPGTLVTGGADGKVLISEA
uniref:Anaphase-promoting complex subunit 4 WD40 domain-containing protein n=1 Tax=Sexangularia sp. CB-2014 TaxID=1486929 RepID=A0A7S1YK32_9EUKA